MAAAKSKKTEVQEKWRSEHASNVILQEAKLHPQLPELSSTRAYARQCVRDESLAFVPATDCGYMKRFGRTAAAFAAAVAAAISFLFSTMF